MEDEDDEHTEEMMQDPTSEGSVFLKILLEKTEDLKNDDSLDDETIRMTERIVIIGIFTKHINLWIRQLEMKRREIGHLAELMKMEDVENEIKREKSLELSKKVHESLSQEDQKNVVWRNRQHDLEWS